MAKRITKEEYFNAYNKINEQINSTLKQKLTELEKGILFDFLFPKNVDLHHGIKEPFLRDLFGTDPAFKDAKHDSKFELPRILSPNEEKFVKDNYSTKNNALSKVALARTMLRFKKVANLRICNGTARQPLRHVVLGR